MTTTTSTAMKFSVVQNGKTGRYFYIPGDWRGMEHEYAAHKIRVEEVLSGADAGQRAYDKAVALNNKRRK